MTQAELAEGPTAEFFTTKRLARAKFPTLRIGGTVHGYRLLWPTDSRDSVQTWVGEHIDSGRVLSVRTATRPSDRKVLRREAALARAIQHPAFPTVHEFLSDSEAAALVMDPMDGTSLDRLLRSRARPSIEDLLWIFQDIATALARLHEKGVMHRAIHAANMVVMPGPGDRLKGRLRDYGRPSFALSLDVKGRPKNIGMVALHAMSPEVLGNGKAVDWRADIWALGVTMFHAFSGQRPHQGRTTEELWQNIRAGRQKSIRDVAPELPEDLAALIACCLFPHALRNHTAASIAALLANARQRRSFARSSCESSRRSWLPPDWRQGVGLALLWGALGGAVAAVTMGFYAPGLQTQNNPVCAPAEAEIAR